jgi:hypothetical protein
MDPCLRRHAEAPGLSTFGRLAVRDERCYTGVMLRDRYFFPLCAAVAIAMIVVAMAGPWGANPAKPDPSAPAREQTR